MQLIEFKNAEIKTHRVRSSELQLLSVGTVVPREVRHTALRFRADFRASFIPVGDLGCALYPPVPRTPSASEWPPRTVVYLPSRDVYNSLMKTEGPHHDAVEKELDFIQTMKPNFLPEPVSALRHPRLVGIVLILVRLPDDLQT